MYVFSGYNHYVEKKKILKIQEAFDMPDNFSFHEVSEDEVRQEILRLD